nr:hypothetical protein [Tanacetum cinerariifolium]
MYIFDSMVKNMDNVNKFLMYPRFVQVFLNNQLEEMSHLNRIYGTPSHKKKIFGNIKSVRKGFSERDKPLFQTMMVQAHEEIGEGSANPTDPHHIPTIIQPSTSQPHKKQKSRKSKRNDTKLPQTSVPTIVADEVVNKEMDDTLKRVATTVTSLDVEQDMGDTVAQTRSERVFNVSNDPLLARVNTSPSGEDSMKINELMELSRVESSEDEGFSEEDASKQGRIVDIDFNEDIYLVNVHKDKDIFGVNDSDGDEVIVEDTEIATTPTISIDKATLAQALAKLKHAKPKAKAKGIVFHEPEESTTTTTAIPKSKSQDKGKAKMIEEPVKLKKKDQIQFNEEVALKLQAELQAEFEKEQRLAAEKAQQEREANIALIKS